MFYWYFSVLDEMVEPVFEEIDLSRTDYWSVQAADIDNQAAGVGVSSNWDYVCLDWKRFFEFSDLWLIEESIKKVTSGFIHHIGQLNVIEQVNAGIDFFTGMTHQIMSHKGMTSSISGQNGSFSELAWALRQTYQGNIMTHNDSYI